MMRQKELSQLSLFEKTSTRALNLSSSLKIGEVYTPLEWCRWAVERLDLVRHISDGKTILDPTAGCGNFIISICEACLDSGLKIDRIINQIFGVEVNCKSVDLFRSNFKEKFGVPYPESGFICEDFLFWKSSRRHDILLGNPPWLNFVDLPADYKEALKPLYICYDLILNDKNMIMGGSRVDIAALVLVKAIKDHLLPGGIAGFFLPASLFQNDGAHEHFRRYSVLGTSFKVENLFDFCDVNVFEKINTRYLFADISRDKKTSFPVNYFELKNGKWCKSSAWPFQKKSGPLVVSSKEQTVSRILVPKYASPRQGLNTCGANDVYIFKDVVDDGGGVAIATINGCSIRLEKELIYPLITKNQFDKKDSTHKFVLLPHDPSDGKPLMPQQLENYPLALEYLKSNEGILRSRKGTMIQSWINRGFWWALIGIGPYSFYPYKIVWQAYGKSKFQPMIFDKNEHGTWQPNQALQAFMPFLDRELAGKILIELQNSDIEKILLMHKMDGKCNWAQPGRVKNFLRFHNPEVNLLS